MRGRPLVCVVVPEGSTSTGAHTAQATGTELATSVVAPGDIFIPEVNQLQKITGDPDLVDFWLGGDWTQIEHDGIPMVYPTPWATCDDQIWNGTLALLEGRGLKDRIARKEGYKAAFKMMLAQKMDKPIGETAAEVMALLRPSNDYVVGFLENGEAIVNLTMFVDAFVALSSADLTRILPGSAPALAKIFDRAEFCERWTRTTQRVAGPLLIAGEVVQVSQSVCNYLLAFGIEMALVEDRAKALQSLFESIRHPDAALMRDALAEAVADLRAKREQVETDFKTVLSFMRAYPGLAGSLGIPLFTFDALGWAIEEKGLSVVTDQCLFVTNAASMVFNLSLNAQIALFVVNGLYICVTDIAELNSAVRVIVCAATLLYGVMEWPAVKKHLENTRAYNPSVVNTLRQLRVQLGYLYCDLQIAETNQDLGSWFGALHDSLLGLFTDAMNVRRALENCRDAFLMPAGSSLGDLAKRNQFLMSGSSVPPNSPPAITSGYPKATPTEVAPGDTVLVECRATDPEGQQLYYQWRAEDNASPGVNIGGFASNVSSSTSWTAPDRPGTYQLSCTVNDPAGAVVWGYCTVTVTAVTVVVR